MKFEEVALTWRPQGVVMTTGISVSHSLFHFNFPPCGADLEVGGQSHLYRGFSWVLGWWFCKKQAPLVPWGFPTLLYYKWRVLFLFQTELSLNLQQLSEKARSTTEFIQRLKGMTDKVNVSWENQSLRAIFRAFIAKLVVLANEIPIRNI